VTLYINPARREEFLKTIKINWAGTNDRKIEPLNVLYTIGESVDTPNTFHFQEQFASKEGFIAHTQSPHFKVWEEVAKLEGLYSQPPKIDFFEQIIF